MIQTLVSPKFTYPNAASDYVTIRSSQDALHVVDRIIEVTDTVKPEVVLDVEILKAKTDKSLILSRTRAAIAGGSTCPIGPSWPNLCIRTATDILANPKIRIQNLEKANMLTTVKSRSG